MNLYLMVIDVASNTCTYMYIVTSYRQAIVLLRYKCSTFFWYNEVI